MKKNLIVALAIVCASFSCSQKSNNDTTSTADSTKQEVVQPTEETSESDYDKLVLGVWKQTGADCDMQGENCKGTLASDLTFKEGGKVFFGTFESPYKIKEDVILIGEPESPFKIIKLTEKDLILHAQERNSVIKYEKKI